MVSEETVINSRLAQHLSSSLPPYPHESDVKAESGIPKEKLDAVGEKAEETRAAPVHISTLGSVLTKNRAIDDAIGGDEEDGCGGGGGAAAADDELTAACLGNRLPRVSTRTHARAVNAKGAPARFLSAAHCHVLIHLFTLHVVVVVLVAIDLRHLTLLAARPAS
ncbi:hypothetical protein SprV_0301032100 [Sparganum proliferum]